MVKITFYLIPCKITINLNVTCRIPKKRKNDKMGIFFALKSQKRQKSLFTKSAKKIFSPVMRLFQNAKDIEIRLKTVDF